jgi:hypothetical protein
MRDGKALVTPGGKVVATSSPVLAKRLLADLRAHGESPMSPVSLVAFHYPLLDFFFDVPRERLQQSVLLGLEPNSDWTSRCPSAAPEAMMRWMALFGDSQLCDQAVDWVLGLNMRQLCAVTVLGRGVESVRVPFLIATKINRRHLRAYANEVADVCGFVSGQDLYRYFGNFLFYYGLSDSEQAAG